LLIINIRLKIVQSKIAPYTGFNLSPGIGLDRRGAKSNAVSGGPHRVEEFSDFQLEAVAVAGQHLCRGENL
jgi:hypothetical protein